MNNKLIRYFLAFAVLIGSANAKLSDRVKIVSGNFELPITPSASCLDKDVSKRTIILVDRTVDDKANLEAPVKNILSWINLINSNEDSRKYLLNHHFSLSFFDDGGENRTVWSVDTSKEYGAKFNRLNSSLMDFKSKIASTLNEVINDKRTYTSSLLIEQINNFGNNLKSCDNLIIISDLLLVDKDGHNFERGIFSKTYPFNLKNGNIVLLRIAKRKQTVEEIKKVEEWWMRSLNGESVDVSYLENKNLKTKMANPLKISKTIPNSSITTRNKVSVNQENDLQQIKPKIQEEDSSFEEIKHTIIKKADLPKRISSNEACTQVTSMVSSNVKSNCVGLLNSLHGSNIEFKVENSGIISKVLIQKSLSLNQQNCLKDSLKKVDEINSNESIVCKVAIR